jgi:hypothetical protein
MRVILSLSVYSDESVGAPRRRVDLLRGAPGAEEGEDADSVFAFLDRGFDSAAAACLLLSWVDGLFLRVASCPPPCAADFSVPAETETENAASASSPGASFFVCLVPLPLPTCFRPNGCSEESVCGCVFIFLAAPLTSALLVPVAVDGTVSSTVAGNWSPWRLAAAKTGP